MHTVRNYVILIFMRSSIYGKEKDYLSYSAISLWKSSKDAYRRRYYELEKPFKTIETEFGKKVAEMLERRDPSLMHIPHYSVTEYEIDTVIDGVKVKAYIDSFDPERIKFLDHKSSHCDKDGKPPWTRVKVHKHDQLPFYSMLLKYVHGRVDNACHIVWIETEFKTDTRDFMGHTLSSKVRELQLTGKVKKFRRVIREWERQKMRKELSIIAQEIQNDYRNYTRSKEVLLRTGGEVSKEVQAN